MITRKQIKLFVLFGFALLIISSCNRGCIGPKIAELGAGGVGRCSSFVCEQLVDTRCEFAFSGDQGKCPAFEVCNNNCNCESLPVRDSDIDGYCIDLSEEGSSSCAGKSADCDDQNSRIYPDAVETCDNIDNN